MTPQDQIEMLSAALERIREAAERRPIYSAEERLAIVAMYAKGALDVSSHMEAQMDAAQMAHYGPRDPLMEPMR